MGDLLKEAIADAKAVRETALANAKMALEEAFTPQLKSMLSAKLREDEQEDEVEEFGHDEETEEGEYAEDEVPAEDIPAEETYEDEEVSDEVPAEEGEYAGEEEEHEEVPAEEDEDNLDLEAVIRELEAELSEGEDDEEEVVDENAEDADNAHEENVEGDEDPKHVGGTIGEGEDGEEDEVEIDEALFTEEDDEDEDKDEVDEQSGSSNIGSGDNKGNYAGAGDEEDPGKGAQFTQVKLESVTAELKEYKEAVGFLKDKLHEVNILNAKLLFTNKLFKSYSLNNNQKLKVVETFDRAQTTREIKLVYSTLAEQFGDNSTIVRKKSIQESASASIGTTKPSKGSRKVISEETQVANRFKKLAGLIK